MKKILGCALFLSLLLNGVLLLRKPQPPPAIVRTQVVERRVAPEPVPVPEIESKPRTLPAPVVTAPVAAPTSLVRPSVALVASSTFVEPGGEISVACTLQSGSTSTHQWVGLYAVNAHVSNHRGYHMVASLPATFVFKAPSTPGEFEVRYILEDDVTSVASSAPIRVLGNPPAKPMVDLRSGTTTVTCGGEIPASWSLLSGNRSSQDWIGLYAPGAKNEDFLTWKYVADADQGKLTLQAPDKPGTYEMRYLLDNGYESVATSVRIVVLP
jgi:Ca-activated chloride channel family protein